MKHNIIQCAEDLPTIPQNIERLYLDFETTSYHPSRTSLNPWRNCWIAGAAFTWDDNPRAYYLPVGHNDVDSIEQNFPEEHGLAYLQALLKASRIWVNHNIKYDAHVGALAGLDFDHITLWDTLTQAKLLQSDLFNYTESHLSKKWLMHEDTDMYRRAFDPWLNRKNKDWGQVPIRLMGPYACNDVLENRYLDLFIRENMPEDCYQVAMNEVKVTRALFRTEQVGMHVDETKLKVEQFKTLTKMAKIIDQIEADHGFNMRPSENPDCFEIFHVKLDLPVIRWTGDDPHDDTEGEPSYDKYALATLRQYPGAPGELIDKCLEYRQLSSHSGYLQALIDKNVDGVIHASYNQSVRTGRMSCRDPNNQQWNKMLKEFIEPGEDRVFLSFDFSSIEFRLLAHYLGQPEILEKFMADPDSDFHQIVADMCGVERGPAKNINFAMAYGGGKARVLSMLASDASIIRDIEATTPEEFVARCQLRANEVFTTYHKMLYKLRPLTRMAASRLKGRGFVRNGYGRHRHLPPKAAYRALNTVIQSTAADVMKMAVVNTSPCFNDFMRDHGVEQVGFVHDEILFTVPKEYSPGVVKNLQGVLVDDKMKYVCEQFDNTSPLVSKIVEGMLAPGGNFQVPMRVSGGFGPTCWGQLAEMPKSLLYSGSTAAA